MDFIDFLLDAKMHSYASVGERDETRLEFGGKRLAYRREEYSYVDVYYGNDPFIGEEIVCKGDAALWGMNYYGLVTDPAVSSAEVYGFLQAAMRQVGRARPFRGPDVFSSGDWEYQDHSDGSLERFAGEETIRFQGRPVYRLTYHGGRLGV